KWQNGKLHVWSHTQGVFPLRGELAKALKITVANVTVTHREGSGCYGHNGADDVALDAALCARATKGRPVKLQWMRDDEFRWEPYGSAMLIDLRAGLDAQGNVVAIESFMGEVASAAGLDPVEFRLRHLSDPRAKAVIEAVASKAGWRPKQPGDGRGGRGIGFAKYKNLAAYVAVVADVEVDRATGIVTVPRAFAVADAGLVVNPDGLINQIEGGVIQSTSWTLREAVSYDSTQVLTSSDRKSTRLNSS